MLEPDTFSLVNYREAETVLADFQTAAAKAEEIYGKLPGTARTLLRACAVPNESVRDRDELYVHCWQDQL